MLKEWAQKKIILASLTLIIFSLTMLCPTDKKEPFPKTILTENTNFTPIYLLNHEKYVSRTNINVKQSTTISLAKEIISILTIESQNSIYIPIFFNAVIPANTKLLSIDLQDQTLKINFDKTFFKIPPNNFRKVLECLVYSLTEIEEIDNILIFIEGDLLKKIPNTNEILPLPLSRNLGVNKTYNISNIKNTIQTTAYYIAKEQNYTYYIPVTFISNMDKNKVEIIIDQLKTRPHLNTNLISYLHANTELNNYDITQQEINLSFSSNLFSGITNEEILEEVKYSITLSMKDSLNVKKVSFTE